MALILNDILDTDSLNQGKTKINANNATITNEVVSSGSNSNGQWVRYYDGTQICTLSSTFTNFGSWGTGNRLMYNGSNWAYPALFSAPPQGAAIIDAQTIIAAGTVRREDMNYQPYQTTTYNLGTPAVYCVTNSGSAWTSGDSVVVRMIAVGRWF